MNLDIVLPSIIVGIIVTMILGFQMLIMESSVESRLQTEVQANSSQALEIIREEMRGVHEILSPPDNSLVFSTFTGDSVMVSRSGRNLVIQRYSVNTQTTTSVEHPLNLTDLQFSTQPDSMPHELANFIRVFVETSSRPEQQVASRRSSNASNSKSKSSAQTDFLLRHRVAVN